MRGATLIVFARRPVPGSVKTRLVPALGEAGAAALHAAMLADVAAQAAAWAAAAPGRAAELCLDGAGPPPPGLPPLPVSAQGRGDLGERLGRAFARAGGPAAAVGADAPTLPPGRIDAAFAALAAGADAAVAPAEDGGYVLLAVSRPLPALLSGIPWGSGGVMAATRARAREAGLALAELPGWHDVDRPEDLPRLRAELRDPEAARRAPATARRLLDDARGGVV